jgi:hypothetical protein
MNNVKELSQTYYKLHRQYVKRRDALEEELAKIQLKIAQNKKPEAEETIKPLAEAIQKELGAKAYYVVGSADSIMSPVKIVWLKVADTAKFKRTDEIAMMEVYFQSYDEECIITEDKGKGSAVYFYSYADKDVKWLAKYARQRKMEE